MDEERSDMSENAKILQTNFSLEGDERHIDDQDKFQIIEADSFLLISDRQTGSEDRDAINYYQMLLKSKLKRKHVLQQRFQRYSGMLWILKIIKNVVKKYYEKVMKKCGMDTAQPKNSNILCLNADGITRDLKQWMSTFSSKSSRIEDTDEGTVNERLQQQFIAPSKDSQILKNLAMIEKECENLEVVNAKFSKRIIFLGSEVMEMVYRAHDVQFDTKMKESREASERRYRESVASQKLRREAVREVMEKCNAMKAACDAERKRNDEMFNRNRVGEVKNNDANDLPVFKFVYIILFGIFVVILLQFL